MKAAIVILNWNTLEYLRRFLPPLLESCEGRDAEVIVADNASTDGSVEMMAAEFPDVKVIELEENFGFTGGYNRALESIDAEYYVLINSDIEVAPDWLDALYRKMETCPECGICGPKLLSFNDRGRFEYAGAAGGYIDYFGYPYCRGRILKRTEADCGQYDGEENVLWVSGACLMIRSTLWRELGGFDSRFFAHMEEVDLCWRAQLRGFKVCCVPQSAVYHIGGGTLANGSAFKLRLNYRNNLLLLENNLPECVGRFRARVRLFARMVLDGGSWCVYMATGQKEYARSVIQAHREFRQLRHGFGERGGRAKIDGLCKGLIFVKYLKAKI